MLAAFARERIDYPAERLADAIADYADLRRLVSVIEASGPGASPVVADWHDPPAGSAQPHPSR